MPCFTIYDRKTGLIKRTGCCQPGALKLQARKGEGLLPEVQGNAIIHRVVQPANGSPYLRQRAQAEIDTIDARRTARLM